MASKKTFEHAARILAEAKMFGLFQDSNAHHLVASQFATLFESTNERFNREMFLKACGVIPTESE